MLPFNIPFNVLPLSWVGAKRRPSQFADSKNAPGIKYAKLKENYAEMLRLSAEAEAKNAENQNEVLPKENSGERILIVDDGRATTRLLSALQNDPSTGSLEVQELPQPE